MFKLSAVVLAALSFALPSPIQCQASSSTPVWFTLNVKDGDTITATAPITLRWGQVASTCAAEMSTGPCSGVNPGSPSPEAWTNPQTFNSGSATTVTVVVGPGAFNGDPLPGVYKTVQVQELATSQNIAVNGQPITVPSLSSPSNPNWFTLNAKEGDTITANGSITLRFGQLASTCAAEVSTGPCSGVNPGSPSPEAWTNPKTFSPASGVSVSLVIGAAAFNNVDPLPGVYKTVQVQEQATPQNITVNGQAVTVPAQTSSSSIVWFTLNVKDGDTITDAGSIILRWGQVASTCAATVSTGPCSGVKPGAPTPETWTNPVTFTATSGVSVNIIVGPSAFGIDPLPGVYKTVQVEEQAKAQNINVNGQPVTVPAVSGSSTCQLAANPSSIFFANTTVGYTYSYPASITNNCSTAVTINSFQSSAPPFTTSGFQTPFSLAPGQLQNFTVVFAPTTTGTATGSITFASTVSAVQPLSIALSGIGVAVQQGLLSSNPATLGFGNVAVNSTQSLSATITNTGAAAVTVSKVSVTGSGFVLGTLTVPLTLGVGKSMSVSVGFAPKTTGPATGTLVITSNAQNGTMNVPLTGSGVNHYVALSWSGAGSQIAGYNVYRSTVSNGSYTRINATSIVPASYSDQNVVSGMTYFYAVTEIGTNGTESVYSNQVKATIP